MFCSLHVLQQLNYQKNNHKVCSNKKHRKHVTNIFHQCNHTPKNHQSINACKTNYKHLGNTWSNTNTHTHTHTHTQNHEKCLNIITHKISYKEQYKHIQKKHEKCLNIIMHKTSYRHLVALDKHKNCKNRKSKN